VRLAIKMDRSAAQIIIHRACLIIRLMEDDLKRMGVKFNEQGKISLSKNNWRSSIVPPVLAAVLFRRHSITNVFGDR
jgi:hypothetical protein